MSTPTPEAGATPASSTPHTREIRLVSHSNLFYWWPVWLVGFIFALWTLIENNRLAIVPGDTVIVKKKLPNDNPDGSHAFESAIYPIQAGKPGDAHQMAKISTKLEQKDKETAAANLKSVKVEELDELYQINPRVSSKTWMGPSFLMLLTVVIIITNVPLRGLWSVVAIIAIVTVSLFISLFGWWDNILSALYGLHVFINMAGYLMIATTLFIGWSLATFIFDNRSYIVFTPGQIKVCEQIGGREKVYDTTGMTVEKHRDDWFRHIFLGFGSGDMTVRTAGADRHEIVMPNVALIGFKIGPIEQLLRERQTIKVSSDN
jgi:hypothetical protein